MNLVSESLNELYKFEKKTNPLSSLGIGKKVLITKWLDEMGIKNYIINDDLTITINGKVDLESNKLNNFPDYIQFNIVNGFFDCGNNNLIYN